MLSALREEHGGIVITAAIMAVGFILLGSALLQVGDWLQHRRHLQMRADAAALAGGQLLTECFATSQFTAGQAQTNVENAALEYAGFPSAAGPSYNAQFGGGSDSVLFQSNTYPGGGGGGPDDTQNGVGECSNLSLDVKLTDSGIPALFSFSPLGTTHAHARVELQSIQVGKGAFPLAIPDVDPKQVDVTFVDETNGGSELTGCGGTALLPGTTCTFLLAKGPSANGLTPWSGSADVKIPAAPGHLIGMRVGAGGQVASCAGVAGTANSSCWDLNTLSRGLLAIRDYAASGPAGSGAAPTLYGVWPSSTCSGSPYFSDASLVGGATSCSVGVQAEVGFGTGATDPTKPTSGGGAGATLTATVNGQSIPLAPVSYDAARGAWLWASTAAGAVAVPVDASGTTSGYPVTLAWTAQGVSCGGGKCSFGTVQRVTSATDSDDGAVKLASLSEPASPSMPPYALTAGTHTLAISIALAGSLSVQTPPKLTALRLTGGSRTTGVNCDGTGNNDFLAALLNGCQTLYQVNENDLCPDPAPPAGPADCVPLKTGNLGTTVTSALNQRFGGCPVNNWPDYTKPGDVRNLMMMLTDFSALSGSGKTEVPVTDFADFYVIGWSGGPGSCGVWPFPGSEPSGGNIWGYFLKYDFPGQVASGRRCRADEITPCTPALTR